MAGPAIEDTDSSKLSRRSLFDLAVSALNDPGADRGGATRMASRLGVSTSILSYWRDGSRDVSWAATFAAAKVAAGLNRAAVPALLEAIASELLGVEVRVVLTQAETGGDWRDENDDVDIAQGDLVRAMRAGDRGAVLEAARRLVEQAEEAASAARLHIADR